MGSSSPQGVADGRMSHAFSQLQGGFSVTDIEKYCKKYNKQNKMEIKK
jgi:hypothetical protein